MSRRYEVIRYPLYYVVIDHAKKREIVFETRNRVAAHRKCTKLNRSDTTLVAAKAKVREIADGNTGSNS